MPPVTTVDERDARAMIDRALDAGVNLIDTADVYAFGQSEEILGAAIRGRRDDVLVATKCGFGSHDARRAVVRQRRRGRARRASAVSALDHIDLYQLHRPDRATPIEETLRALDDLVTRGLVREIGTSNFRAWEMSAAVGAPAGARVARVHRRAALLLAGRARGRARAHPGVPGRRPRA